MKLRYNASLAEDYKDSPDIKEPAIQGIHLEDAAPWQDDMSLRQIIPSNIISLDDRSVTYVSKGDDICFA